VASLTSAPAEAPRPGTERGGLADLGHGGHPDERFAQLVGGRHDQGVELVDGAILARIADLRATRSTRIISTLPSADFGIPVAWPESTERAAPSASVRSSLPRWRRTLRSGRSTSITVMPRARSQRNSPAPYDPVPSIPTRSTTPSRDAHSSS
jgi:hypothetical protein